MSENNGFDLVKDEAPKAEPRGFAPEEMVTCEECLRANAPTRETCFYCSASLPETGLSSPESLKKAEILRSLGLEALPDEEPAQQPSPKRIRSLEFADDVLVASTINATVRISVRWNEFVLLVAGRLIVSRVEVEQGKSRRNKKPAARRELTSDDAVFDLFTQARDGGWRIAASSFDFSCLGPAKSALAAENFVTLMNTIRSRALNATFDDSYGKARKALAEVWPVEPRSESSGWKRAGMGKFSKTTTTIEDNEAQFTRYSQLRHYLRLRELVPSQ